MTLQDWTNVATIVGALGSFMVAVAALVVSVAALRTQREALPVSAVFGITGRGYVDTSGVRWMQAWVQNTGVMVYVHEVYRLECLPLDLPDEKLPNVARVGVRESLPQELRSKSKRELLKTTGVFNPQYLPSRQYSMYYVSCPPGVDKVKLAATMSVRRRDKVQFVSSEWLEVPSAIELIVSS